MAINFDSLPQDKPQGNYSVFEKGVYQAKIVKAEMATSNKSGAKYLSVQSTLTNDAGETTTVFDNFFDNEKPLIRYKLGQFIRALDMGLTGNFELADLTKIIIGREYSVAIKVEQTGDYPARNVVDAYDDGIYYKKDGMPWVEDDGLAKAETHPAEEGPIY